MPILCKTALNKTPFNIFGNDYPTKDGTAIRDYIHVVDLARSHVEALKYLNSTDEPSTIFNIGTGKGYSVLEIVNCFKDVNNVEVQQNIMPRRDGDPTECFADNKKALSQLNWMPEYNLSDMCLHSWNWGNRLSETEDTY